MNRSDERARGRPIEGTPVSAKGLESLKEQIQDMQLEIVILKETIHVLKKDPGASKVPLNNREKAVIVDALKEKYPLPLLLSGLRFAKSSYYYQRKRKAFSEKVIRRIMEENGLTAKGKSPKKFRSYLGEISPAVPDLIRRDFRADRPDQKWLTDITEFSIPAEKVYLSPVIDCYDGMPIAWSISTKPNTQLVNSMLDRTVRVLPQGRHPIIHSDYAEKFCYCLISPTL